MQYDNSPTYAYILSDSNAIEINPNCIRYSKLQYSSSTESTFIIKNSSPKAKL